MFREIACANCAQIYHFTWKSNKRRKIRISFGISEQTHKTHSSANAIDGLWNSRAYVMRAMRKYMKVACETGSLLEDKQKKFSLFCSQFECIWIYIECRASHTQDMLQLKDTYTRPSSIDTVVATPTKSNQCVNTISRGCAQHFDGLSIHFSSSAIIFVSSFAGPVRRECSVNHSKISRRERCRCTDCVSYALKNEVAKESQVKNIEIALMNSSFM